MVMVVILIPQGHAHLVTSSAKVLAENPKQRAHKEAKVVNERSIG
jgi:large subunit ribosomal protein L9